MRAGERIAAPHPNPLPTEEWGEGISRHPARLRLVRQALPVTGERGAPRCFARQHARLEQSRHLPEIGDRLERLQALEQRRDLVVGQRTMRAVLELLEQL